MMSIANFLVHEQDFRYFNFYFKDHGVLVFHPQFIAVLFFMTILLLFYDLYCIKDKRLKPKIEDSILL
jgi:hypothetical protein